MSLSVFSSLYGGNTFHKPGAQDAINIDDAFSLRVT